MDIVDYNNKFHNLVSEMQKNVSLFTSRFRRVLFLLKCILGFETLTLSPLARGPLKLQDPYW